MTQLSLDHDLLAAPAGAALSPAAPGLLGAYPRHYSWVITLAILDIVMTTVVLGTGGRELNAVARWAIDHAGVLGMIAVKATTLTIVLFICEYLARHRPRTGRRVAELALLANSAAVACGLIYLAQYSYVMIQWTYLQ